MYVFPSNLIWRLLRTSRDVAFDLVALLDEKFA